MYLNIERMILFMKEIIGSDNVDGTNMFSLQLSEKEKETIKDLLSDISLVEYHELLRNITMEKKYYGLKFTDIATSSNLPVSTVKRIFYGSSIPQITNFIKVLDVMGLKLQITKK